MRESVTLVADLYPSLANELSTTLPFLTVQDFDKLANQARALGGIELLAYSPYITNDSMRSEWEAYSTVEEAWVDGLYHGHLWKYDQEGKVIESGDNSGPYLPSWQMSPTPVNPSTIVNFDYASTATYIRLLQSALEVDAAVLSEPIQVDKIFADNLKGSESAYAVLFQPVKVGGAAVAFVSAVIDWASVFINVFDPSVQGVYAVVDSCGTQSTFVMNGAEASFVGFGDLHDGQFNNLAVAVPFDSMGECKHTLYLFPSSSLQGSSAQTAAALTATVVLLFVAAAVCFLVYDGCLRRKQMVGDATPWTHSHKTVEQIFPVAKTLPDSSAAAPPAADANMLPSDAMNSKQLQTKDALMKYVNGGTHEKEAKPIAELFPEATVLFAGKFADTSRIRDASRSQYFLFIRYRWLHSLVIDS